MGIDRARLAGLLEDEQRRFRETHPRSAELFARSSNSLLGGVSMTWMRKWSGGFPIFAKEAMGAHVLDVDGIQYVDFCLGDTGAMAGHSAPAAVSAIVERARQGMTLMLPTEDSIYVGEEMARRFGLPYWQFTLSATDANRFAVRIAREITARPKILVFHFCYHGTVDETFAALQADGAVSARAGNVGPPVDPAVTTKVVEWNDIPALEAALAARDVACVLAEPALTNIGIVLPESGFHAALREITRRTDTLLILDETHTLSAGPGGYTGAHGLEPDVLTLGKPIGGGIPVGAFGASRDVARRMFERQEAD
jgi:glutamate-1-semialdehyde 2,1-aminomutase